MEISNEPVSYRSPAAISSRGPNQARGMVFTVLRTSTATMRQSSLQCCSHDGCMLELCNVFVQLTVTQR